MSAPRRQSSVERCIDWIDERAAVRALWRAFADEPIPGGARFSYVFGSVLFYLFVQQVVLGIALAFTYAPSVSAAWASTAYLNDRVTLGWLLRGLHHYSASAMVVLTILHFGQVVLARAYARPRELNWLTGLFMGGLVLAFALTGYLLPWDQKGYWATKVATNLVGSVPGGGVVQTLLQGGADYGNLTLTHFYAVHVFVLPLGFALLLALHLWLFRRHGVTSRRTEVAVRTEAFFPRQTFYDLLAMTLTAAVLFGITLWTHGAELLAPAQPGSNFAARPEWYFLPLFRLLELFDGRRQALATVVIPGVAAAFVLLLPWIDHGSRRSRRVAIGGTALLLSAATALGMLAALEDRRDVATQRALAEAAKQAVWARSLALQGVPPAGGEAVFENDPAVHARRLFDEHCASCHAIDRVGADKAPDFADYGSRRWLSALIRNPQSTAFFGGTEHTTRMDPFPSSKLRDRDLEAIVEYVASLSEDPTLGPIDRALAARGEVSFDEHDCTTCHEVDGKMGNDGPNLRHRGTAAWVASVIADPSAERLFGENARMPKFGDKLDPAQIEQLARLIVGQRRARGERAQ